MRISIVPAQITTVEDKIAGNISVHQAMLLGLPILFGFATAVLLPPSGQFVAYKIVMVAVAFVICGSLSLRIKDRIVAKWLALFAIYCARPKYYIYDKNTSYLRASEPVKAVTEEKTVTNHRKKNIPQTRNIAPHEFARLERFAADSRAGIKFAVGRKGELNVRITEVE